MFKKDVNSSLELKQILTDVGLYEPGLSVNDMKKIYNTINTSKCTANDENEYRELLIQTETNCTNIESLTRDFNKSDTDNNDKSKTILKQRPTSESKEYKKNKKIVDPKQLLDFDFSVKSLVLGNSIKIEKPAVIPVLYYQHPIILNLPTEKRAEKILKYLQKSYRKSVNVEEKEPILWGKPILPSNKFNGDLCIDYVPEEIESNDENKEKSAKDSVTYLRRVHKRKICDEEFDVKLNKITKANTDESTVHTNKNDNNNSTSLSENYISKNVSKIPFIPPKVSERTNKLMKSFQQSKGKKLALLHKRDENMEFSDDDDDDDDIFSTVKTTAQLHKEITLKTTEESNISTSKILTRSSTKLKLTSEKENQENISQIPAKSFYSKNKENELDLSNNNKSSTSNSMTQCPICSVFFPNSEIQDHASTCDQFEMDVLCDICSKFFSSNDINNHKSECLKEITECSTRAETVSQQNKTIGYLCSICDKYVTKTSELDHASNCIATLKDK